MAANACVCDVAGKGGQMNDDRNDLPDYSELSTVTERCLKPKVQIYTAPRNGTYTLLCVVALTTKFNMNPV